MVEKHIIGLDLAMVRMGDHLGISCTKLSGL